MKVKFSDLHLEAPNAAVAVENMARGKGPRTESNPLTAVLDGKRIVLDGHHRIVKALLNVGDNPDAEVEVDHTDDPTGFEGFEGKDWRSLAGGLTSPQLLRGTIREVAKKLVQKYKPEKLARVKAPAAGAIAGGGTSSGGIAADGGQFMAKPRLTIREAVTAFYRKKRGAKKLAKRKEKPVVETLTRSEHDELLSAAVRAMRAGDVLPAAVLADRRQELGLAGAHLLRHGAAQKNVRYAGGDHFAFVRPAKDFTVSAVRAHDGRIWLRGTVFASDAPKFSVGGDTTLCAPDVEVRSRKHLAELMQDWSPQARSEMWSGVARHLPSSHPEDDQPLRLAKKKPAVETPTRSDHDALVSAASTGLRAGTHLPLAILADYLSDSGRPGAHLLRHAAAQKVLPAHAPRRSLAAGVENMPPRHIRADFVPVSFAHTTVYPREVIEERDFDHPALWLHVVHTGENAPMFSSDPTTSVGATVRVNSRKHLAALMQDWPAEARAQAWQMLASRVPSSHPEDDQPLRLAKKKPRVPEHLRTTAPYSAPDAPLPLDPATEIHSVVRDVRGQGESFKHRDRSLSVGEVKQIEDMVGLPENHASRLTRSHKGIRKALAAGHTDKRLGDGADEIQVSLDQATEFLHKVATHRMKGADAKVRKHLQDPTVSSPARLAYMIAHLGHEAKLANKLFEGAEGAEEWYGNHVAVMARHLLDSFGGEHPELWGTVDKKTQRVALDPKGQQPAALTLAKLLVAATSGGEKPDRNYAIAHRMISAAVKKADGDPNWFAHLPTHQTEEFEDWVDRALDWHKQNGDPDLTEEDVRRPGTDLNDRAAWWHRVVRPLPRDLGGNRGAYDAIGDKSPTDGYGYTTIRGHVIDDPEHPHDQKVTFLEKGKAGWLSPYPGRDRIGDKGKGAADRTESPDGEVDFAHRNRGAKTKRANLPITDALGYIQPKLYSARGATVNKHVKLLQAVIRSFVEEAGSATDGLKNAAAFFTNPQSAADVVDRTRKIAQFDAKSAKRIARSLKDNKSMFFEDDHLPGAFILGPKFGAFSQNLHLDVPAGKEWNAWRERYGAHLTADLWWSRTWNRLLGTMFEGGKRVEAPRGGKSATHPERKVMRKVAHEALKKVSADLGLRNVAELQAALWYSEQQLYRMFGVKSDSRSYKDGVDFLAPGRYAIDKEGTIHVQEQAPSRGESAAGTGAGKAGAANAPRGADAQKRKPDGGAG